MADYHPEAIQQPPFAVGGWYEDTRQVIRDYVPYGSEVMDTAEIATRASTLALDATSRTPAITRDRVYETAIEAVEDYTTPLVDVAVLTAFGLLFLGLGGAALLIGTSGGLAGAAGGGTALLGPAASRAAFGLALPLL